MHRKRLHFLKFSSHWKQDRLHPVNTVARRGQHVHGAHPADMQ
jgi:hypothetical protein